MAGARTAPFLWGYHAKQVMRMVVNDGQVYNSLEGCPARRGHMEMAMDDPRGAREVFTTSLSAPRVEGAQAVVEYTLAQPGEVSLAIFSVLGRRVANLGSAVHEAGVHRATVPLEHMAHGIYFVRMNAGGKTYTRRMPVLRTR